MGAINIWLILKVMSLKTSEKVYVKTRTRLRMEPFRSLGNMVGQQRRDDKWRRGDEENLLSELSKGNSVSRKGVTIMMMLKSKDGDTGIFGSDNVDRDYWKTWQKAAVTKIDDKNRSLIRWTWRKVRQCR